MNITEYNEKAALTDAALIEGLALHEDYLAVVYKKHKDYCIKFMQKQCNGRDFDDAIKDIYHDAVIVLYEKVKAGNFTLTSSIQTYLNAICRNQLLNRFKDDGKFISMSNSSDFDNEDAPHKEKFMPADWLPSEENSINERVEALMKGLEIMKGKGDCYELLSLVYYHNKSMQQVSQHFDYKNEQIAKNKNYRCKEKLRELTFETLKKIR